MLKELIKNNDIKGIREYSEKINEDDLEIAYKLGNEAAFKELFIKINNQVIIFKYLDQIINVKDVLDINIKSKTGLTLLSSLIIKKRYEDIFKIKLNGKILNKDGSNALKQLSETNITNKTKILSYFLNIGVDFNNIDKNDISPISYFILNKNLEYIKLIEKMGGKPNTEIDKNIYKDYILEEKIKKIQEELPELIKENNSLNGIKIENILEVFEEDI